MNNIGRNKTNWLLKQECVFKPGVIYDEDDSQGTVVRTKYGEYITLADLGDKCFTVNFIYKHRLSQLSSINRARGLPLDKNSCNTVSIGFSEKEQAWYGWTHRGYGKFYIGYEVKEGSIIDNSWHKYPFKVETLDQAKELAIHIADYLN